MSVREYICGVIYECGTVFMRYSLFDQWFVPYLGRISVCIVSMGGSLLCVSSVYSVCGGSLLCV